MNANKMSRIISELADRLADESDYESHLQPMLSELADYCDPYPFEQVKRCIEYTQDFCEHYNIRGVDYLDNLFAEVLAMEDKAQ